jgi:hypothetical protein
VADAAEFGDLRQTALARALALAPNDPEVLARMADLKASNQEWDQAAAFSRKAVRLRAMSPRALDTHVMALAHTGQCREAAFYMAALSSPLAGGGHRGPTISAGLLDLLDRCMRIAAERAMRHDQPAASGATGAVPPPSN